jgi:flagellar hook-length control protein FliK
MSPDRTAPTSLRPTLAPRTAAPEASGDGFAALLGAADKADAPARRDRTDGQQRDERRGGDARRSGDLADPVVATPPSSDPATAGEVPPVAVAELDAPSTPTAAGAAVPAIASSLPFEIGLPATTSPVPVTAPEPRSVAAPDVPLPGAPVRRAAVSPPPVAIAAPSTTSPAPVAGVSPQPAETPVVSLPGAPGPVPASPTPFEAAPAATAPVAGEGRPETVQPAADTAPPAPTAPAAAVPAANTPAPDAGTTGEQGSAPHEQPAAPAAAPAPTPASAPTSAAPAPALPVAPLAPRAAPLHQAPRAVAQMLQVAVERGLSHAKLNLRPAELGGIEIRLQTSAAGVTAQVVADSPEAARLLHQAADDLRRSLERHDVTLLSLDVSTAGDDRPDGSAGASADLAGDRSRHFAAHGLTPPAAAEADEPTSVVATVQLPDGLHVDVLA